MSLAATLPRGSKKNPTRGKSRSFNTGTARMTPERKSRTVQSGSSTKVPAKKKKKGAFCAETLSGVGQERFKALRYFTVKRRDDLKMSDEQNLVRLMEMFKISRAGLMDYLNSGKLLPLHKLQFQISVETFWRSLATENSDITWYQIYAMFGANGLQPLMRLG